MKRRVLKHRNVVAKDLGSRKYRQRIIASKKYRKHIKDDDHDGH